MASAQQDAFNLAKSRLLQKHRDELAPIVKDIKKKKGLLKEAAQKKADEIEARHAVELAEFVEQHAKGGSSTSAAAPATAAAPAAKSEGVAKVKKWPVLNWSSQARSELEQMCGERGLSKKGKKEDLVVRLTLFSQEQQRLFDSGEAVPASDSESDDEDSGEFEIVTKVIAAPAADGPPGAAGRGGKRAGPPAAARGGASGAPRGGGRGGGAAGAPAPAAPAKKAADDDDDDDDDDKDDKKPAPAKPAAAAKPAAKKDDDDDDDDDDDSGSESSEDPYANETPEQKAERERLEKRRMAVIGCIWRILKQDEEDNTGIHINDLPQQLAENGVKNFRPELVGYTTIEEFLEEEQGKYFKFGSNTKLIKLIKERDESGQAKRKPNARAKGNNSGQRGMKG